MSRITRVLLPAVFIIALCGVATSSAFATEDPFYKLGGKEERLKAGETREVGLKAEGNQTLVNKTSGITIVCTGIEAKAGATIIDSNAGEPGTSLGVIVYSGCTVKGNGEKCIITSVAGAKDKNILTNALKDELELAAEKPVKGTKILDLFKPVSGAVIAVIKFEAEAGGKCTFASTAVEGTFDVEILNSKKLPVAFEENEKEELSGFIKPLPSGTKECKLKEGKLDKCTTSSLKAFGGSALTVESIGEVTAVRVFEKEGKEEKEPVMFGVFSK